MVHDALSYPQPLVIAANGVMEVLVAGRQSMLTFAYIPGGDEDLSTRINEGPAGRSRPSSGGREGQCTCMPSVKVR